MHSRLFNQFNRIHRFSIFILISWGIFGVCSSLLTLQAQSVEYFCITFYFNFNFNFNFFCFLLGGSKFKTSWAHHFNADCILDIFCSFPDLWVWWANFTGFCAILQWAWSIRLVSVSNWHRTIVFAILIGHATADQFSVLCTHSVCTGHIQKGNYMATSSCWKWKMFLKKKLKFLADYQYWIFIFCHVSLSWKLNNPIFTIK